MFRVVGYYDCNIEVNSEVETFKEATEIAKGMNWASIISVDTNLSIVAYENGEMVDDMSNFCYNHAENGNDEYIVLVDGLSSDSFYSYDAAYAYKAGCNVIEKITSTKHKIQIVHYLTRIVI